MKKDSIKLRPFALSDIERLAQLANNKNVWDNLRDYIPHPYTEKDAEEYIIFCNNQNPMTNFAIAYNDELVGTIGLILQKDVYRKSAEIGYWIGEPYWGKGIVTKAVELMVEYGFQNLDIIRIFTGVFDFNIGSQKVLEKNGFEKEAIFKNAIFKNGKICNEVKYAKIK